MNRQREFESIISKLDKETAARVRSLSNESSAVLKHTFEMIKEDAKIASGSIALSLMRSLNEIKLELYRRGLI